MCGIVGYIGNKNTKDVLLECLKRLEYRGYDSSGIALLNAQKLQVIKSTGKIEKLEKKLNKEKLIIADLGIAHTRWATHGVPNIKNAHPHTVGRVTIVHNGIIENADKLRKKFKDELKSDTDSEVVAALINKYLKGNDVVAAINKALVEITGSYALGIIVTGVDELFAVRKNSPLIVGLGQDENFIASDIMAIIDYTKKYILLGENEVATITKDKVLITKNGKTISKEIMETDLENISALKNGYPHYMLKEIMEQDTCLDRLIKKYQDLEKLIDLSIYDEVHIVACGSAMYAGMVGKNLLEEYSGIRCLVYPASEYRYLPINYAHKTIVILISQSGETADTIAAMNKALENKIKTLGIVNVETSTIARETDEQLFIKSGPEIAVATTKAYISQVMVLILLVLKASLKKKTITTQTKAEILEDMDKLPRLIKEVLEKDDVYKSIAQEIYKAEDIFFIGRKIDYAISLEGSLKLKEVSYIHSEAYQAGELKHGTISLIKDGMPVFAIITDDSIRDKTLSNVCEVESRGAKVITITNQKDNCKLEVLIPKVNSLLQPILVVPVLQLIAYNVAVLRKCDIDKPKNLAKSVTVE